MEKTEIKKQAVAIAKIIHRYRHYNIAWYCHQSDHVAFQKRERLANKAENKICELAHRSGTEKIVKRLWALYLQAHYATQFYEARG
jgi:hypothetical protein